MQLFKRYIARIGNAHYYHDGSGHVRDIGLRTVTELRAFMKREQVPLIDQRVILPEPLERRVAPEPLERRVAPEPRKHYGEYRERKIVGRY